MQFELTKQILKNIKTWIANGENLQLIELLENVHFADIAEILEEISFHDAIYIIKLLDSEKTAGILAELDDDTREKVLNGLSSKEIAEEIDELNTDDAADIISELPEDQKEEVIAHLEDIEHAKDIVELLRYEEDTAGGLMGKEMVQVNENWTNITCVKEMRRQAANVDKVHTIYVIDDNEILKGRLSLKSLLTTPAKTPVKEIYNHQITSVGVTESGEEVARIMQKYDLFVIPVIDEMGRLTGQITIDDIVDIIKDEAEKDYQMAAGLVEDVEADDTIFELVKGRLPWLVLGLFGGLTAASILTGFDEALKDHKILFMFIPLIAAMAGNVGVQSSAIMVQGLANNNIKGSLWHRLLKEIGLSLVNGSILSIMVVIYGRFFHMDILTSITISLSLLIVMTFAALIGTFVPLILHKKGIDPALATGPFITTSNDIFGIFIFFYIAKLILGF